MIRSRFALLSLLLSVLASPCLRAGEDAHVGPFAGAQPVPADFAAGFNSITEADSEQILKTLVEGDMKGRGTGQEGYLKAAKWFASQLEANGFQPAGDNGTWFQNVPFIRMNTVPDKCQFAVGSTVCVKGDQLGITTWNGSFDQAAPVTFAILGETKPEIAEGACAGRLLVVQGRGRLVPEDAWILKAKPACVLIVQEDSRVRNETVNQNEQTPSAYPAANVIRTAANALAAACGQPAELFAGGDIKESQLIQVDKTVDADLVVEREPVDMPNVVGWYPGSDTTVANQHIIVGAHLDHLGVQRGELFPGADDNGSGSSAILQVAKAIHANPVKPRRSILLMAFCAEERGLLGSKYYVQHPLKPLSDAVCMLNIDMIGRDEEAAGEPKENNRNTIHLVGSKDHSSKMHALVEEANKHVGFVFEYDEEDRVDGRSDHASFSNQGIPVAFLFGGFNPYYHQTTDTMDGINFSKIANAARLYYLALMSAAEHGPLEKDLVKK